MEIMVIKPIRSVLDGGKTVQPATYRVVGQFGDAAHGETDLQHVTGGDVYTVLTRNLNASTVERV